MDNSVIMHVNCVEQGQSIREMCEKAVSWGYDGIEFRRKRVKEKETPEDYLGEIEKWKKITNLAYVMFGGPGPELMSPDKSVREQETEECVNFYRMAAQRFDLKVCNFMTGPLYTTAIPYHEYDKQGSAMATDEHWQWAIKGLSILGNLANELGFKLALETHMGYLHDLPLPSRALVDKTGKESVGLNLDYGNMFSFPVPPSLADAIKICGDRLYMMHLKNVFQIPLREYRKTIPCGLADGVVNYRECMNMLKKMNFNGPLVIETARNGDREWFIQQDLKYLKNILEEV